MVAAHTHTDQALAWSTAALAADSEVRRTSDWISETGQEKLREYGIAPPERSSDSKLALFSETTVACPQCGNTATEKLSEFGSASCKAQYRCTACAEPFDYFKCI